MAISNPAFEYWYLLHFRLTNQPFRNAEELEAALRARRCLPNYDKTVDVFDRLAERTEIAIVRARTMLDTHLDRKVEEFPNSSTTVYHLVQTLLDMRRD